MSASIGGNVDYRSVGTFKDVQSVWELYPKGGSTGQYFILESTGEKHYWDEVGARWGIEETPGGGATDGTRLGDTRIEGDLTVDKTVTTDEIKANKGSFLELVIDKLSGIKEMILEKLTVTTLFLQGEIGSADFFSGILGKGWRIKKTGDAEFQSLTVREFLEVPEYRKNRIVVVGDKLWASSCGTLSDVQPTSFTDASGVHPAFLAKIKLEDGEDITFRAGDILIGNFTTETGFRTSYTEIVSIIGKDLVLNVIRGAAPQKFMVVARMGNTSDKNRQGSILIDGLNKKILILKDVDKTEIDISNIAVQIGDLSDLNHPAFGQMEKDGIFVTNLYAIGRFLQLSWDGTKVTPLYTWEGEWSALTEYHHGDQVSYNGSVWLCVKNGCPLNGKPDAYPVYWELYSKAGDNGQDGIVLRLSGDRDIKYNKEGVPNKTEVSVYANVFGLSDGYTFTWKLTAGETVNYIYGDESIRIAHNSDFWAAKDQIVIDCTMQYGEITISDTFTVNKILDGKDVLVVSQYSTNGTSFLNGFIDTTLYIEAKQGDSDCTADILDRWVTWTKIDQDGVVDDSWGIKTGKSLHVTRSDVKRRAVFSWEVNDDN